MTTHTVSLAEQHAVENEGLTGARLTMARIAQLGHRPRVLVCGGNEFSDEQRMDEVLSRLNPAEIIHGDAPGADRMAGAWARNHSIPEHRFPADWDAHGRRAGYIRNQQMLDEGEPDVVVGFPGGKGTVNMVSLAKRGEYLLLIVKDRNGRASVRFDERILRRDPEQLPPRIRRDDAQWERQYEDEPPEASQSFGEQRPSDALMLRVLRRAGLDVQMLKDREGRMWVSLAR